MEKLLTQTADWTLETIKKKIESGKLEPNPEYQRDYVYKDRQASKLIESVLLNIPIPTIYIAKEEKGYSIIDGQQRCMSIFRFLSNAFKLTGLEELKQYNGKYFKDLEDDDQQLINDTTIRVVALERESEQMKYEIFARLNQGAVKLNPQELRNCLYRGPFNNMLKEVANKNKNLEYLFMAKHYRMNYEENILRFFALRNWLDYKGALKETMNSYMFLNKNLNQENIDKLKTLFTSTINVIKQVLGKNAFCAYDRKNNRILDMFSGSVYDSIIVPFSHFPAQKIIKNADEIKKAIENIKINDIDYQNDTYAATGSKDRLFGRIEKIYNCLKSLLGADAMTPEQRLFDKNIKAKLWEKSHTCAICGNEILDFNDAEVDHKVPYSKGGEMTIENAQLAHGHGLCNQMKSNKME